MFNHNTMEVIKAQLILTNPWTTLKFAVDTTREKMPEPTSKPHRPEENTAGEQSKGPQTVPKATRTVEQAKQG